MSDFSPSVRPVTARVFLRRHPPTLLSVMVPMRQAPIQTWSVPAPIVASPHPHPTSWGMYLSPRLLASWGGPRASS